MRHVPFFRWVLALGLVLIGGALGVHLATPEFPELRQIDLTVVEEEPDGTCTVRWRDPFEHGKYEGPYLCDAGRSDDLKAPNHNEITGFGWDTGFVIEEGPDRGELYSLEEDGEERRRYNELSDTLVAFGLLLTVVGLVGGSIRGLYRVGGADSGVVRRAERLREAADSVAEDYRRAVEAVHEAWAPFHRELVDAELDRTPVERLRRAGGKRLDVEELRRGGFRTVREVLDAGAWGLGHRGVGRRTAEAATAAARRAAGEAGATVAVRMDADRPGPRTAELLAALRVLVEAGPGARKAAEEGVELAARLDLLLAEAAPASRRADLLRAGPEQRRYALDAMAELRLLVREAEREKTAQWFAQASVDLLRGQDRDPAGLSARVDFESRPREYHSRLAEVTGGGLAPAG
ncbi:hypothetical protein ACLIYM_22335 [Streptomyces fenghuangensis]|uniref:hypothetical protein n=1 Tax=Streptomyces sp. ICN903 TaxID=2964654 RepID=UPI001EDC4665|nr:hypothetical protein [Streptomyces sp. ICN903]MCG3043318.1 hypothetical protein [Streptomyces sp. ICN903]